MEKFKNWLDMQMEKIFLDSWSRHWSMLNFRIKYLHFWMLSLNNVLLTPCNSLKKSAFLVQVTDTCLTCLQGRYVFFLSSKHVWKNIQLYQKTKPHPFSIFIRLLFQKQSARSKHFHSNI